MKPTPTHNTSILLLHGVIITLNSLNMIVHFFKHQPLVALIYMLLVSGFIFIGLSNFKKFFSYRKEMKTYNIEQKNLELKQLEAAFATELKKQTNRELQEKFSFFK